MRAKNSQQDEVLLRDEFLEGCREEGEGEEESQLGLATRFSTSSLHLSLEA